MAVKRTPSTARTSARQIALAERRAVVLGLRRQGLTFAAIAAHIGGVSAPTCYRDVVERRRPSRASPHGSFWAFELARFDQMQRSIYRDAVQGSIASTEAVLRIMDRRCKLLGLYSSARVALSLEGAADFGVRVKISSGKAAN